MTQISKRQLVKDLEHEIYDVFWSTIVKFTDKKESALFFSDLFTTNERINFTKRLAISILLYKEYDWKTIKDLLKVSDGTIAKMSSKIDSHGFKLFFAKLERDRKWQQFWKDLAKTYLTITHGDKVARLGDEGIEKIYFKKKSKLLH
ncbi:hypothetical protein A3B51_01290 [Candidatus Curtissbacteria bacterium RIFCSPLOWO2_01_FULL_41_18]|uniref:Uncharacterized protein n=2 Tax=Candidatus Curtissiibacteriota TaxID=1752717 RepID=A0A1F5FZM8_9BACT|nr:MAG: hypothetical protein A2696_00625 [Candidatus Curtissbacteria bacterium RIFCSPHIGHO2_01_FULL_41_13]OGE03621.1 MAG: hypothetical protein A3B51_01290 [Candidatus Curtissbacteria bacterium RIFCSPLOWO2_01_FULL_41_18]